MLSVLPSFSKDIMFMSMLVRCRCFKDMILCFDIGLV